MVWNFDPIAIRCFGVAIPYYTFLFSGGLVLSAVSGLYLAKRASFTGDEILDLSIYVAVGILVCAHLVHLIFYEPRSFWQNPRRIIELGVGLASHGGALGALLAIWYYARKHKLSFLRLIDLCTVVSMWLAFTIRVGNFLNSEIIGRPTDLPWGVIFVRAGFHEPRHPVQLYEALIGLVLLVSFGILYARKVNQYKPGTFFFWVITAYMTTRFFVEFFKEDDLYNRGSPLSMGQLLSLVWLLLLYLGMRKKLFRQNLT